MRIRDARWALSPKSSSTSSCTDRPLPRGGVHVYNLDSLQHHARVPVGSEGGFPTAPVWNFRERVLLWEGGRCA